MSARQQLLAERAKGLGGSDAAALAGVSRWRTPLTLYYEKRGELPRTDPSEKKSWLEWGLLLEPHLARYWAARTAKKIRKAALVRHPTYKQLLGHPDYWIYEPESRDVLEIKTAMGAKRTTWINEGIPLEYYLQVQWYLLCSPRARKAVVAVLFGGNEFDAFEIAPDLPVQTKLQDYGLRFWALVENGTPPPPTYDALGSDLADLLYRQDTGGEVRWTDEESAAKVSRLLDVKAQRKTLELEETELEAWCKWKLGPTRSALIPQVGKLTWSTATRRSLDKAALDAAHPGLTDAFQRTTLTRTFRATDRRPADATARPDPTPEELPEESSRPRTRRGITLVTD